MQPNSEAWRSHAVSAATVPPGPPPPTHPPTHTDSPIPNPQTRSFPSLEKRAKQRPSAMLRVVTAADPILDPITRGFFKMVRAAGAQPCGPAPSALRLSGSRR